MKVYVLISATALPGKSKEARKAVIESVQYLNKTSNYVGEYEQVIPAGGPNSRVYWLCKFQSMADNEKDIESRSKDIEWSQLFEKIHETVDVDNITSEVFRVSE